MSSVVKIVQNGLRKSKKELKNNSKGEKSPFDKNVWLVLAMREIGWWYSALEKLCGYLNLSPLMQVNAFNETQKNCFRGVQYCSIAINDRCSWWAERKYGWTRHFRCNSVLWWLLAETGSLFLKWGGNRNIYCVTTKIS